MYGELYGTADAKDGFYAAVKPGSDAAPWLFCDSGPPCLVHSNVNKSP